MELRHLRYFAAVAEERHFGRAAKKLFVSQPSLSFSIKSLEREFGAPLFRRHPRGVELTDLGVEVFSQARKVLAEAERVQAIASRSRAGETGRLRVGFQATGAGELSAAALGEFGRRHPKVKVELKRFDWGEDAQGLRGGEVDVAFVWLPCDEEGLVLEVVSEEVRYAGVHRGHPLAGHTELSVLELNEYPMMWNNKAPRIFVDFWTINPRPDGTVPRQGPTNENVEEMLEQVAAGRAYCTGPKSMARFHARPDLVWVPITDVEPLRIAIGYSNGETSTLVAEFVKAVRETARSAGRFATRAAS